MWDMKLKKILTKLNFASFLKISKFWDAGSQKICDKFYKITKMHVT